MTAFYVQALRNGCRVAAIIGDRDRCDALGRRAEQAAQAFQRELWTPERGLYADGRPGRTSVLPSAWLPADPDRVSFSLHTNALAVACGVAPSDLRAAVLARAVEDPSLPRPQPYFMHYVLNALAAAGLFERFGLGLIRQWKAPLDEHPSSWKENWDWGDYSHAWSSTPTYQLSTRVLGVTPAAPGFAVAAVRPLVCDLAWARGRVPTPRGPVSVSWRGGERDFDLEVEVPPGSTGRVSVPGLGLSRPVVRENGQTVWPPGARPQGRVLAAGPDGDGVAFTVPAGAYRFHVGP
jgi:hypothetical protein